MARAGYEKIVDVEVAKEKEPRRFHKHLCCCFGNCDAIGWASCCFVTCFPIAAIGVNFARTTGTTMKAVAFALLFVLLVAVPKVVHTGVEYRFKHTECLHLDDERWQDEDRFADADSAAELIDCSPEQLQKLGNVVVGWLVLSLSCSLGWVLLGCMNRRNTRRALDIKYDVEGPVSECCDDTCAWVCWPCGLCQETRTYMYNRVYEGEWRGPAELHVATV